MDILSILGLLLAIGGILLGQWLEGGNISSIVQLTAFVIVIGGTTGAVMIQYKLPIFLRAVKMLPWMVKPPASEPAPLIEQIISWSHLARKSGLLALESSLDGVSDPFLRRGLQMLVDGAEPQKIRDTLLVELEARDALERQAAKVFESAGGYAPTIGILGAVLGLIHVMENLADPSKLGAGIATAFVATIYGVGSANIFFLPVSNKLKGIVHERAYLREMLIEGLVGVAEGENPKIIEARLQGFFVR
ncbi:MAG: flagellar motor protein [Acidithiobacillus sp.]|nr:flagellar motor protein [Acidithiobacillus sp.]MCE5393854.1 flagellar motor protein [Acidithiobacillus sp.]